MLVWFLGASTQVLLTWWIVLDGTLPLNGLRGLSLNKLKYREGTLIQKLFEFGCSFVKQPSIATSDDSLVKVWLQWKDQGHFFEIMFCFKMTYSGFKHAVPRNITDLTALGLAHGGCRSSFEVATTSITLSSQTPKMEWIQSDVRGCVNSAYVQPLRDKYAFAVEIDVLFVYIMPDSLACKTSENRYFTVSMYRDRLKCWYVVWWNLFLPLLS